MTIVETTTDVDREKSIRQFTLEISTGGQMPVTKHLVALTSHSVEDVALDGEAPYYLQIPGNTITNAKLSLLLVTLAQELLILPHLSRINHPSAVGRCCAGAQISKLP